MVPATSSVSGIGDILSIVQNAGFQSLTPLQEALLAQIPGGKDFFVNTHGQRGKSLAVLIAVLLRLDQEPKGRALVIAPEPKDVEKLETLMAKLISHNKLRHISVTLGPEREPRRELRELNRNPDVIIGNPGRIIDHIRKASLHLEGASIVAIFISQPSVPPELAQDLGYIFSKVPRKPMALFFSPEEKDLSLMEEFSRKPQQISLSQTPKEETNRMTEPQKGPATPHEDAIKEALITILGEIRSEVDPKELDGYKKLLKKHVPLTMRSYVGAYFLRQMIKGRAGRAKYPHQGAFNQGGGSISRKGFTTLFFNIGKNRRIYAQDLTQLLNDSANLVPGDIGFIRILDSYSFVEVRESKANRIIKVLNNSEFRNKKLAVAYARKR